VKENPIAKDKDKEMANWLELSDALKACKSRLLKGKSRPNQPELTAQIAQIEAKLEQLIAREGVASKALPQSKRQTSPGNLGHAS
jgi:hypothetical protein